MPAVTITIQTTFDVARARNQVRRMIASYNWSPPFAGRTAAAITALGEAGLLAESFAILQVHLLEGDERRGLAITCDFARSANTPDQWLEQLRKHVERSTDELAVEGDAYRIRIHARLWVRDAAQAGI